MIYLKDPAEIDKMRRASLINAAVHEKVRSLLRVGITTQALDAAAEQLMLAQGGKSSFREQFNYPGASCISINDEIGHGVPGTRRIADGDLIKVDIGVQFDGYHSDCAKTYLIGHSPDEKRKQHLISVTRQALREGLAQIEPGRHLSDVSYAIGSYVENAGLSVVKKAHGHGIGTNLHEDPQIPNYGPPGRGPRLRAGMVLAIEPVVVDGDPATKLLDDGWTEATMDGSYGAHFEHTVLVTKSGAEILTVLDAGEDNAVSNLKKDTPEKILETKHGLHWRKKREADNQRVLSLAQQEMDPILLEAWGRPVHPMEILSAPASTTYVVTDHQGQVQGFCIFSYRRPYLHLNTLVLDQHLHGSGVARIVMDLIGHEAQEAGMSGIELWVQTNNRRAIRFYEKLGFIYTGEPYFRTWSMRKRL